MLPAGLSKWPEELENCPSPKTTEDLVLASFSLSKDSSWMRFWWLTKLFFRSQCEIFYPWDFSWGNEVEKGAVELSPFTQLWFQVGGSSFF